MAVRDDVPSSKLHFIHFNDVYNIEPRENSEPAGGAARFQTLVDTLRSGIACRGRSAFDDAAETENVVLDGPKPLLLFSGDAFNPSLMSTVTKGVQMVPVLNGLGVEVAVYGNHDFDFGVDVLEDFASRNNFPWMMSNVIDNYTGLPLAGGKTSHATTVGGRMIGFLGLVEDAWIETLATIDADQITYLDFVEEGRKLAQRLRNEGAEVVIALTHMRWPNDRRLAESVEEIDIVLGGHDHEYGIERVQGRRRGKDVQKIVLKSGTDFRELSTLTLNFHGDDLEFEVFKLTVDSSISEHPETKTLVDSFAVELQSKMEEVLGVMDVELDGRFGSVRTKETNLGNFVCDVMLAATDADFALLNSGTLRSDTIHPAGSFSRGDLTSILPFVDPIVVLRISGREVLQALENSVCMWPVHEGRFAQVAGIRFAFDPSKKPGSRVNPRYVEIQGNYVELDAKYKIATKAYVALGKDGYDCFLAGEVLVDEETGPILRTSLENHFESIKIVRGEKNQRRSKHRQPLLSRRSASLRQSLPTSFPPPAEPADLHASPGSKEKREPVSRSKSLGSMRKQRLVKQKTIEEMEKELAHLSPSTDDRIVLIDSPAQLERLEDRRSVWEVRNNPTQLDDLVEDVDDDVAGWGVGGGSGDGSFD